MSKIKQRPPNQPTRLRQRRQIPTDLLKLRRRHRDRRRIVRLGNAEMLLIDVHELDVVLAQPVALLALKHHVHDVGRVLGLEREDVLVRGAAEHLCERGQVDAERDVPVAAEGREAFRLEHHRDERDVGVVHGLQGDARVVAVEVTVLDKVADGVDDLEGGESEEASVWAAQSFV